KDQLSKLAWQFLPLKKNSKLISLSRILKKSQLREFDFGDQRPSGLELDFEDEDPQDSGIELAVEPQVSPAPEGMPSFVQNQPAEPVTPKVQEAPQTKPEGLPSFLQNKDEKEDGGPITPFSNLEAWG